MASTSLSPQPAVLLQLAEAQSNHPSTSASCPQPTLVASPQLSQEVNSQSTQMASLGFTKPNVSPSPQLLPNVIVKQLVIVGTTTEVISAVKSDITEMLTSEIHQQTIEDPESFALLQQFDVSP